MWLAEQCLLASWVGRTRRVPRPIKKAETPSPSMFSASSGYRRYRIHRPATLQAIKDVE
jgi:hypothetical protein